MSLDVEGVGGGGVFFFKQTTAYEVYQCDWSSDVCSSDLVATCIASLGLMPSSHTSTWAFSAIERVTFRTRIYDLRKNLCTNCALSFGMGGAFLSQSTSAIVSAEVTMTTSPDLARSIVLRHKSTLPGSSCNQPRNASLSQYMRSMLKLAP